MTSVEFLVKMRDGATIIVDACNEELEKKAPVEVKCDQKDFDALAWTEKEGTKAAYEQTTEEANQNNDTFRALQQILVNHKGFAQISGIQYWFHREDKNTIDRRRK